MGFGLFSSLAASQRAARPAFLFFNRSSFQYRWHALKGTRNKKRERHKRKCNLNSKHSSVMRQWVTAMGAQTLKATFKSRHATLGTWASTCWGNIRLQAAAWEVCGIQSVPPLPPRSPHQFNYIGSCRSFRLSLSMKRLKCSCCCRLNMSEVLRETFNSRPAHWYLQQLALIWENAAAVHMRWANWTWNHPSDVWNGTDKRCCPFIPHSVQLIFCHFVFRFTDPPGKKIEPTVTAWELEVHSRWLDEHFCG